MNGRRIMTADLLHKSVDVQDTYGLWCEATIQELDFVKDAVFIHYCFWTSRWDEWIPFQSPRIEPRGSRVCAFTTLHSMTAIDPVSFSCGPCIHLALLL